MLRIPTYASASLSRPSLLMRYLRAIGPGTVIVKAAHVPFTRNDALSAKLLRYHLSNYAYHPVTDMHFPLDQTPENQYLRDALSRVVDAAPSDPAIECYTKWKAGGMDMLRRWHECLEETGFSQHVNNVEIPESGTLVILGSVECYLSFDRPLSFDGIPPLRLILEEAGYASNYRLQPAFPEACLQVGLDRFKKPAFDNEHQGFFESDLGMIFLGRANGRTVVILGGASCPFGTFAATRLATDYGRNEVNQAVLDFYSGQSHRAVTFYAQRKSRGELATPYRIDDPISIKFIGDTAKSVSKPDLDFRRAEFELSQLDATPKLASSDRNALVDFLNSKGTVGVICKWYPNDLRDDATAVDILEFVLDDTINYSVPSDVPEIVDSYRGKCGANGVNALTEVSESLKKFVSNPEGTFTDLMRLDWEARQLFEIWEKAVEKRLESNESYATWVDQIRTPTDGTCIILGDPVSFQGYQPQKHSDRLSKLGALINSTYYPNRYYFKHPPGKNSDSQIAIFDRMTLRQIPGTICDLSSRPVLKDSGIVSLAKGPNGRDVLVIAGISSLATLAGVNLLFTQRRPSIDEAIREYAVGKRKRIDLYYTCEAQSEYPLTQHSSQSNGDASNQKSDGGLVVSDDKFDLWIDTHDSEFKPEFFRNPTAEACFVDLFAKLEATAKTTGDSPITIPEKEKASFEWKLKSNGSVSVLTISCKTIIDIGSDQVICSQPTYLEYQSLEACFRTEASELDPESDNPIPVKNDSGQKTLAIISTAKSAFCGKYLILGDSGTGKEMVHKFLLWLIELVSERKVSAVRVNSAGISSKIVSSEIFGAVPGTFTSSEAIQSLFEKALGSVLFMDEFCSSDGPAALELQATLLRTLESGTFTRVGGGGYEAKVNCLFVAATNRADTLTALENLAAQGIIRPDVLGRFTGRVFSFLRLADRPLEILPVFIQKIQSALNKKGITPGTIKLTVDGIKLLLLHQFPSNFRDLDAAVESIVKTVTSKKKNLEISTSRMLAALPGSNCALGKDNEESQAETWVEVKLCISRRQTQFPVSESPDSGAADLAEDASHQSRYKLASPDSFQKVKCNNGYGHNKNCKTSATTTANNFLENLSRIETTEDSSTGKTNQWLQELKVSLTSFAKGTVPNPDWIRRKLMQYAALNYEPDASTADQRKALASVVVAAWKELGSERIPFDLLALVIAYQLSVDIRSTKYAELSTKPGKFKNGERSFQEFD